jgi:hypothetical protein
MASRIRQLHRRAPRRLDESLAVATTLSIICIYHDAPHRRRSRTTPGVPLLPPLSQHAAAGDRVMRQ